MFRFGHCLIGAIHACISQRNSDRPRCVSSAFQHASNVAWALLHLGYVEGGKRFIEAISSDAIEAFKTDPYIQHQGNFGWSLMGLSPERTDLIARVRQGLRIDHPPDWKLLTIAGVWAELNCDPPLLTQCLFTDACR